MRTKNKFNKKSKYWGQRIVILKIIIIVVSLSIVYSHQSIATTSILRSSLYISPLAKGVLQKFGISEAEIEDFTNKGIQSRAFVPIDNNRLYEGSEDALRIDIRKKSRKLLIELSVRQGGSVHNMLERWCERRLLPIEMNMTSSDVRRMLHDSISELLDDLKSNYNSSTYKRGEMIPEDYRAERDD